MTMDMASSVAAPTRAHCVFREIGASISIGGRTLSFGPFKNTEERRPGSL